MRDFAIIFQLQSIFPKLIFCITWSKSLVMAIKSARRMLLTKQKVPKCQQNVQIIYFILLCLFKTFFFKLRALFVPDLGSR